MEIQVKLNIKPISVNAAFQGRRFKTVECMRYEDELWYALPQKAMVMGEVEIWFEIYLVNYARTDISNLIKVTEDILVKKGYIEDDRKVKVMHISKIKSHVNLMTITIKSIIIVDERSIKKRGKKTNAKKEKIES